MQKIIFELNWFIEVIVDYEGTTVWRDMIIRVTLQLHFFGERIIAYVICRHKHTHTQTHTQLPGKHRSEAKIAFSSHLRFHSRLAKWERAYHTMCHISASQLCVSQKGGILTFLPSFVLLGRFNSVQWGIPIVWNVMFSARVSSVGVVW